MIPKYDIAKHRILTMIAEENYDLESKLPDEVVLSKKIGFSGITIRRAMKELEKVGIIKRIQGRGSFVSQKLDAEHSFQKDSLLFLQINSLNPDSNSPALFQIWDICRTHGYKLSCVNSINPGPEITAHISKSSGIIITGKITEEWLSFLDATSVPYVVMGEYQSKKKLDAVRYDWKSAMRGVLTKLINEGSRKIAFFNSAQRYLPSLSLYQEYCQALLDNGITPDESMILWNTNEERRDNIYSFLNSNKEFDSIITNWSNYPLAVTLLNNKAPEMLSRLKIGVICYKEVGFKEEDNIFTASFDDSLANKSIKLLLQKITHKLTEPARSYYLEPKFNFKK